MIRFVTWCRSNHFPTATWCFFRLVFLYCRLVSPMPCVRSLYAQPIGRFSLYTKRQNETIERETKRERERASSTIPCQKVIKIAENGVSDRVGSIVFLPHRYSSAVYYIQHRLRNKRQEKPVLYTRFSILFILNSKQNKWIITFLYKKKRRK